MVVTTNFRTEVEPNGQSTVPFTFIGSLVLTILVWPNGNEPVRLGRIKARLVFLIRQQWFRAAVCK
jgi:hypothetical protein